MRPHPSDDTEFEFGRLPVLTRRRLLAAAAGSAAALAFALDRPTRADAEVTGGSFSSDPFRLGVASGDPLETGVVIWTRLAPRPFEPFGGVPPDSAVSVDWQVATDENFTAVVRSGTATAHPEYAFTVHVDVRGLLPATEYFYRFRAGGQVSPVGRTRTTPVPSTTNMSLSFAFASCSSFNAGYFDATGHMADEDVDVIFFLGDYIYEYPLTVEGSLRVDPPDMPSDFSTETGSLSRYRLQYAAHKSEPELIRAHQVAPWIVTWDDHEVVDGYAYVDPADPANADFLVRRANAYRAYWEHMPLRAPQAPVGPDARLYRSLDYGKLARFHMLDDRQYRRPHLTATSIPDSPERRSTDRTMLGDEQEAWFLRSLTTSTARWNLVPQGVLMSMFDIDDTANRLFSAGGWDAYQASQQRVLDTVADNDVSNFVVFTGDVHRNYVLDMHADTDDPDSPIVGAEFVGTSLTSGSDGTDSDAGLELRYRANPHLHWGSLQRGYVRGRLSQDLMTVDYREVPYVTRHGAPVYTKRSFAVEAGRPGIQDA
ncbi:MAG: alkaline phosphatase D family protein [Streptosporangiales bacterium]|nr:alkaline phosphatase D family protein [Streptosporangiales bacterium]MBO0892352.1 alkaline phosphatase D family protein [Acidothermales bacterium]